MIQVYEELNLPVSAAFVQEFLQYPMVAGDFAAYYALYEKYQSDYQIMNILKGMRSEEIYKRAEAAPYEERVTLVHLLFEALLNLTNQAGTGSDGEKAEKNRIADAWNEGFVFLEGCFGAGL